MGGNGGGGSGPRMGCTTFLPKWLGGDAPERLPDKQAAPPGGGPFPSPIARAASGGSDAGGSIGRSHGRSSRARESGESGYERGRTMYVEARGGATTETAASYVPG